MNRDPMHLCCRLKRGRGGATTRPITLGLQPLVYSLLLMAMLLFSFLGMASGSEIGGGIPPAATASVADPASFDLPALEVMEWRAIDAETRAIRAEALQATMERASRQKELLKEWEHRFKIVDWADWQIDFQAAKLLKRKQEVPIVR